MILIDVSGIKKLEEKLKKIPNDATKILNRTIKETVDGSGKIVSDVIRQNYSYIGKVGLIKKAIKVSSPTDGKDITASINVSSGAQPLRDFVHNPKKMTFGRGKVLTVKAKNGGGPISGAFKTVMKNNHIGIYKRIAGKFMQRTNRIGPYKGMQMRQAIDQLFGPSIAAMAGSEDSRSIIEEHIQNKFDERLEHNIEYMLESDK